MSTTYMIPLDSINLAAAAVDLSPADAAFISSQQTLAEVKASLSLFLSLIYNSLLW